jgi:hypothetical protein
MMNIDTGYEGYGQTDVGLFLHNLSSQLISSCFEGHRCGYAAARCG